MPTLLKELHLFLSDRLFDHSEDRRWQLGGRCALVRYKLTPTIDWHLALLIVFLSLACFKPSRAMDPDAHAPNIDKFRSFVTNCPPAAPKRYQSNAFFVVRLSPSIPGPNHYLRLMNRPAAIGTIFIVRTFRLWLTNLYFILIFRNMTAISHHVKSLNRMNIFLPTKD